MDAIGYMGRRMVLELGVLLSLGLPASAWAQAPPPATQLATPFIPVALSGTPHDEEGVSVRLRWKKAGKLDLRSRPTGAAKIFGVLDGTAGETLKYDRSVVLIEEPAAAKARQPTTLSGWRYDLAVEKTGKAAKLTLAAGDRIFILKYQGEGDCIVQHGGQAYYVGCPGSAGGSFSGLEAGWKAKRSTWWVHVKGGWLKVSAQLEVTILRP